MDKITNVRITECGESLYIKPSRMIFDQVKNFMIKFITCKLCSQIICFFSDTEFLSVLVCFIRYIWFGTPEVIYVIGLHFALRIYGYLKLNKQCV